MFLCSQECEISAILKFHFSQLFEQTVLDNIFFFRFYYKLILKLTILAMSNTITYH